MSGWTPYDHWARILVASFFFVVGTITLLVPMTPGEPPAWLVEARLRYGGDMNGPKPVPAAAWQRVGGLAAIGMGVLQLLPRQHPILDRPFLLVMGGLFLVLGLVLLIVASRGSGAIQTFSEKRQRRRFERRVTRGKDAYFEEMRTILSQDPPPRRPRRWEVASLLATTLFGAAWLVLGLVTPR